MDLDYYLSCKQICESIIKNYREIKYMYSEINRFGKESMSETTIDDINEMQEHLKDKNEHQPEINMLRKCIQMCNEHINKLCNHNYQDDTIDISPYHYKDITYCVKCGKTL